MYGNIVSSNGLIDLEQAIEKEIKFETAIYNLSINVDSDCIIYINDDPDGIFLPTGSAQPFMLNDLPVWKFKIIRYKHSLNKNYNNEYPKFLFSYYGFY